MAAQPPSPNKLVQIAAVGIAKDKNAFDPDAIDAAKQLRVDGQALVKGTDLRLGITGHRPNKLDDPTAARLKQQLVALYATVDRAAAELLMERGAIDAVLTIPPA